MPKFSKRHYEAVAAMFRKLARTSWKANELAPTDFVRLFSEDNPSFDPEKFRKACSPKE